jgi:ABC-type dipeptide/oligopeptide/nickel transport system permease subunit
VALSFPNSSFHTLNEKERYKIVLLNTWRSLRKSWFIYSRNKLAVFGLILLLFFVLLAFAHPILMQTVWEKSIYDPVIGHDMTVFLHPSAPSAAHLLGTDTLGRDVLSMLMAATNPSLQMALTAAFTAAVVGLLIAAFSAYHHGWVDFLFTNLADLSLLAPAPIMMVIIGFLLDIRPFLFGLIYGVLAGIGAVGVVLRVHALSVMNKTFISASKMAGGGAAHIISRHLIPHLLPLASVNMLLTVTGAIFANGFVAFLGLSRANLNWGSMIYDSFTYQQINATIPWNVLLPSALAISFFAASFYFIALGLHDVVDPRAAENMYTRLYREDSGNIS